MEKKYIEFYEKMSRLEIVTLRDVPESRKYQRGKQFISGVCLKKAYAKKLQEAYPFPEGDDWNEQPYSLFKILKDAPPSKLLVIKERLSFEERSRINVKNWGSFIDSFRRVRNNLVHGSKLYKEGALALDDRDQQLISGALAFIDFLENKKIVRPLY